MVYLTVCLWDRSLIYKPSHRIQNKQFFSTTSIEDFMIYVWQSAATFKIQVKKLQHKAVNILAN